MKKITLITFVFKIALCVQGVSVSQDSIINLEEMAIDTAKITISGFSAGSTMATQLHIAHSSIFHGAALFSQAYYRCGASSLIDFGLHCTKIGETIGNTFPCLNITHHNIELSIADVYRYERQGRIDALENLKRQKVYFWTGEQDKLIPFEIAVQNYDFYLNFIDENQLRPREKIVDPSAVHLYPSDSFGGNCSLDANDNYHIGNCLYSGAYESIRFLLGDQIQKPEGEIQLSELKKFNQSEFYYGQEIKRIGMAREGFIYIPKSCGEKQCLLHFHFHGCGEGAKLDGSMERAQKYIENNGLLEVAEVNNIIMVYPLTTVTLTNNRGCWDFFQFTGRHFATKNGTQIKIVRRMLDRLSPSLITEPSTTPEDDGSTDGSSTRTMYNLFVNLFLLILSQNLATFLKLN